MATWHCSLHFFAWAIVCFRSFAILSGRGKLCETFWFSKKVAKFFPVRKPQMLAVRSAPFVSCNHEQDVLLQLAGGCFGGDKCLEQQIRSMR